MNIPRIYLWSLLSLFAVLSISISLGVVYYVSIDGIYLTFFGGNSGYPASSIHDSISPSNLSSGVDSSIESTSSAGDDVVEYPLERQDPVYLEPFSFDNIVANPTIGVHDSTEECANNDFGQGLLTRWLSTKDLYCDGQTVMNCYKFTQIRHGGPDTFCSIKDALVYGNTGKFDLNCQRKSAFNIQNFPPEQMRQWSRTLSFVDSFPSENLTVVENPTFFVFGDCVGPPYNPFHCLADLVNTFLMTRMFSVNPKDSIVVLYSGFHDATNIFDIYSVLGNKIVTPQDLSKQVEPTLYKNAIIANHAGGSFTWKDGWITSPCPFPSPLLVDFVLQVTDNLELESFSVANFCLKYNDSERIMCRLSGKKNSRLILQIMREKASKVRTKSIRNKIELFQKLGEAYPDDDIVAYYPQYFTMNEQLRLIRITDFFVGIHGGAFANIIYMQFGKYTFELFPEWVHPRFYENFALWSGKKYSFYSNSDPSREDPQSGRNEGTTFDLTEVMKGITDFFPAATQK